MSFINRTNSLAFKTSVNNPDIIYRNFLPIDDQNLFDDASSYINRFVENGEAKDISTERQEKNGTLILYFHNLDFTVGLFTNNKGYTRYQVLGNPARVINMSIELDEDRKCFYNEVKPLKSIEKQLMSIVNFLIFSKDKIHEL